MSIAFSPAGANSISAQPSEGEITHQSLGEVLPVYNPVETDSLLVRIYVRRGPVLIL